MSAVIGRVALYVELDGETKLVALPQDRLRILVSMAGSLSDNGRLPVVKAPPGTEFHEVEPAAAMGGES